MIYVQTTQESMREYKTTQGSSFLGPCLWHPCSLAPWSWWEALHWVSAAVVQRHILAHMNGQTTVNLYRSVRFGCLSTSWTNLPWSAIEHWHQTTGILMISDNSSLNWDSRLSVSNVWVLLLVCCIWIPGKWLHVALKTVDLQNQVDKAAFEEWVHMLRWTSADSHHICRIHGVSSLSEQACFVMKLYPDSLASEMRTISGQVHVWLCVVSIDINLWVALPINMSFSQNSLSQLKHDLRTLCQLLIQPYVCVYRR